MRPTCRCPVGLPQITALAILVVVCLPGCGREPHTAPTDQDADQQVSEPVAQPASPIAGLTVPGPAVEASANNELVTAEAAGHPIGQLPAADQPPPATALELRQEASQLAERLVEQFPGNVDALEIKARFLMLFGESQEAKKCWQEALRLAPDYGYAVHGLGRIAALESHYEEAIDWLSRALPQQPGVAEPVHELADAYTKLGRLDEAIETLRTFVETNPQSALTWLLLGQAYQAQQQYAPAEQAFRSALRLAPGTARAQQGLATVLIRLGKRDEAKQLLADLRSQPTGDTRNRSAEQVFQDEMKECSERFQGVAEFYATHRDLRHAEQVAQRAVVLDPHNLKAKSLLGEVYQQQGRLPEAIAIVRELGEAEPHNASWPFTLGILLAQSGDVAAAAQEYRKVIEVAPRDPSGYEALIRLSVSQQQVVADTLEQAQQLVQLRGSAADHELLAQVYAIQANYAQAEQALQTAMRLDPANSMYPQAMQQLKKFLGGRDE